MRKDLGRLSLKKDKVAWLLICQRYGEEMGESVGDSNYGLNLKKFGVPSNSDIDFEQENNEGMTTQVCLNLSAEMETLEQHNSQ